MFNIDEFKRLLLPVLHRFYIVIICFGVALFAAYKMLLYTTPLYESTVMLKLDDQRFGSSNNKLYKDFDVFVSPQQIEAEVQVLKSAVLLEKAIDKLDFTVSYYRIGAIKTTELYDKKPFIVKHNFTDTSIRGIEATVKITGNNSFNIALNYKNKTITQQGNFDKPFVLGPAQFEIIKDTALQNSKDFDWKGNYSFKIRSKEEIISEVTDKYLDIKSIDKDVPIIRMSFKSNLPQKAAAFINALAQAYIDDYVNVKTESAAKTVEFIDQQLERIGSDLKNSENNLEKFKLNNNVVNTSQETETGLRKLAQQKIDLLNVEMENKGLDELSRKINSNQDFTTNVPNFGYGDLLFTELMKKLKTVQDERRDLLLKYTPQHPKVKTIDDKIADVKKYITDGIATAKKQNDIKKAGLETDVNVTSHQFDNLPTREKNQLIKERTFHLNEVMYNFLQEKRTEAAIQKAANISFHRIIQYAQPSKTPVSPNKTLITFVAGLFGLIIGIIICFIAEQTKGTAHDRTAIEKLSSLPVLGLIGSYATSTNSNCYVTLIKKMQLNGAFKQGMVLTVTSTIDQEGKTFVSKQMAQALKQFGYSVLYLSVEAKTVEVLNGINKKINLFDIDKNATTELLAVDEQNSFVESNTPTKKLPERIAPFKQWKKMIKHKEDGIHFLSINKNYEASFDELSVEDTIACINELKTMYDVVLIDGPASALHIDAVTFLKASDVSLYLFRTNKTNKKYVQHADALQQEYGLQNMYWVLNDVKGSYSYHGHYNGGDFTKKNWLYRLSARVLPFDKLFSKN